MLRVLIWQVSNDTQFKNFALQILEYQHDGLEIVGEASNDDIAKVDRGGDYEILAVGAKKIGMSTVTENARRLNLPEEKLLGDWIVCIPGFTLEKYRRLQRSHLSIFAINCFGGFLSNTLGLSFRSPFVNLFLSQEDFITFLRTPSTLINNEPYFEKMAISWQNYPYPLLSLGNISLNMLHYKKTEEAIAKWNERKKRINWYNIFVEMFTDQVEILEQFDSLPYGKKVCFVPFKSDLDSAWYINPEIKRDMPFWNIILHFARGIPFYYDVFDMLLYGKKTPLIEM